MSTISKRIEGQEKAAKGRTKISKSQLETSPMALQVYQVWMIQPRQGVRHQLRRPGEEVHPKEVQKDDLEHPLNQDRLRDNHQEGLHQQRDRDGGRQLPRPLQQGELLLHQLKEREEKRTKVEKHV